MLYKPNYIMEQNATAKSRVEKIIFPIILGLVLVGAAIFRDKRVYLLQRARGRPMDAQVDADIKPRL